MKAMILAAGLGTRLRPFSDIRPKPLFPILDKPLLLYIIEQLRKAGCSLIVVNAHHLRQQFRDLLSGENDIILQEEEQILGTGGGLRKALSFFDEEPVLVTNGDIFHTIDYAQVYREHCDSGAKATMVLHDHPRYNNVGVSGKGRITGFGQDPSSHKGDRGLAFTGIHIINPEFLWKIPEGVFYNIIDCYREHINEGTTVASIVVRDHCWVDMGTPQDYLDLHAALLLKRLSPSFPFSHHGPFFTGKHVQISSKIKFIDWVSIGSEAKIGSGAVLERVVVWDGAEVPPDAHMHDTIVY